MNKESKKINEASLICIIFTICGILITVLSPIIMICTEKTLPKETLALIASGLFFTFLGIIFRVAFTLEKNISAIIIFAYFDFWIFVASSLVTILSSFKYALIPFGIGIIFLIVVIILLINYLKNKKLT